MVRIEQKGAYCTLHMPSEMTIYTAETLHRELLETLEKAQDCQIDLTDVNEIDSAGMQLLMAMNKQCNMKNKPLALINSSAASTEIFTLFGMQDFLTLQDANNIGDNNES